MILSNFSPISSNHTVNTARHKLPDMVTYAVLAAQRLPLRDFAWNNSVQTVSRRKISTGSTLLGETTNPGWNERFPAGLVAQALLPVLAIAELIMSARAGRFRKPYRMNTYKKGEGGVQFSRDTSSRFSPTPAESHSCKKRASNCHGITSLQKK